MKMTRRPRAGTNREMQESQEQLGGGVVRRVSALGLVFAALVTMFRHLKMVKLALSPTLHEERESDRAGRLAELEVAST